MHDSDYDGCSLQIALLQNKHVLADVFVLDMALLSYCFDDS